jgi:hypothetical protein
VTLILQKKIDFTSKTVNQNYKRKQSSYSFISDSKFTTLHVPNKPYPSKILFRKPHALFLFVSKDRVLFRNRFVACIVGQMNPRRLC